MYPGMYPPYGGYAPYGYPPSSYPPYGYPPYGYAPYGNPMGYGGYSPYGMSPPTPAPTSEAEVSIYDNYFEPRAVHVTPGGTVRWINKGKHNHTVTGFSGGWGSKDIRPGKTYTLTLKDALNHHYYCSHHRLEMNGTIVVRQAQPGAPPGGYQQNNSGGYSYPK